METNMIFEQVRASFLFTEYFSLEPEPAQKITKKNTQAEQQALAKYGLDFVTDKYLPEKLTELGVLQ
ncbi:MAG: hypothetical protein R6W91_00140 [Thermoplasmata archaeon]